MQPPTRSAAPRCIPNSGPCRVASLLLSAAHRTAWISLNHCLVSFGRIAAGWCIAGGTDWCMFPDRWSIYSEYPPASCS